MNASETSILHLLESRAERFANRPALSIREQGSWRTLSYGALSRGVRTWATEWVHSGLLPGDRVAILSESRPEWAMAFLAGVRSGAVCVPLDPKLTQSELANLLSDCRPRILAVSSAHLEKAHEIAKQLGIQQLHVIDTPPDTMPDNVPMLERALDETALLVYTSGTTGNSKGVMITFGNLLFEVKSFERAFPFGPGDRFLSILPLNHSLELTGGLLGVLNLGGTVYYSPGLYPQDIMSALVEHKIQALIGVPLFFRTLRNGIEREITRRGTWAMRFFRFGLSAAAVIPAPGLRRLLFRPVHRRLGGHLRAFVSGGAPLEPNLIEFFDRLGIPLLQGYGLTETGPVVSVNTLKEHRPGSVGRPLDHVNVRIEPTTGEILVRGPNVFAGYYHRPDLTAEVTDPEGWFHTGDLGEMDADGFLYIRGRSKNLIVLQGGKKVHPEEVEERLSRSEAVEEICILGCSVKDRVQGRTEEVCAVIVPSTLARSAHEGEGLEQFIRREIEELSRELAPFKRPTRVFIYPEELPKTTSRKVRRHAVLEWLERQ
ncbi:MAG TPA: AMP-binding protein, partial [Candidatus Eisenbacteria bacterium]|nr:AMP-binding protein [Candidatus Eisenbacteria bacterium]